jgi:hypothetical protein
MILVRICVLLTTCLKASWSQDATPESGKDKQELLDTLRSTSLFAPTLMPLIRVKQRPGANLNYVRKAIAAASMAPPLIKDRTAEPASFSGASLAEALTGRVGEALADGALVMEEILERLLDGAAGDELLEAGASPSLDASGAGVSSAGGASGVGLGGAGASGAGVGAGFSVGEGASSS